MVRTARSELAAAIVVTSTLLQYIYLRDKKGAFRELASPAFLLTSFGCESARAVRQKTESSAIQVTLHLQKRGIDCRYPHPLPHY